MNNTLLISSIKELSEKADNYMDKGYYLLLMSLLEAKTYDTDLKKRISSVMLCLTTNYEIAQRRGF